MGRVDDRQPEAPLSIPSGPSRYTIEGMIDGYGDLALGATRLRGRKRLVAKVIVLLLLLGAPIALIMVLVLDTLLR